MPTFMPKAKTHAVAGSADAPSVPAMSSPSLFGNNATTATATTTATTTEAALTLSLGGVHFCLQPNSITSEVSFLQLQRQQNNGLVLSLTAFTGTLVVSQDSNLVSLQTQAQAQAQQHPHTPVEEEPHSPDNTHAIKVHKKKGSKTVGGASAAAAAVKVSPGQQTLSFVVKSSKAANSITKPTTSNSKDRKRRKNNNDNNNNNSSTSTSSNGSSQSSVAEKKTRREFFPLPTAKKHNSISNNKVNDETKKGDVTDGAMEDVLPKVDDVPLFQASQTQPTQDEEGDDEDEGVVDDIDVSQTMDSSTTDNNNINNNNDDGGGNSVATACGDEDDLALDEAGGKMEEEEDNTAGADTSAMTMVTKMTTMTTTTIQDVAMSDDASFAGYSPPPARWGHTTTKIQNDRILVYGGQSFDLEGNPVILSDVHVYCPKQKRWEKPINCRGESRQWHTASYLPDRQMIIAFGGETQETINIPASGKKPATTKTKVVTSESLRVLDTDIMLWYPPAVSGDIPTGRSGHSATYIPETNELVLFGGVRASKWLNALSILDVRSWVWTTPKVEGSPPKPRSYHSATQLGSNKIVIFGGNNNRQSFNTVHVLEAVPVPANKGGDERGAGPRCTWRWSNPTVTGRAPFPRTGHSATLLEDGKTICVYGGWDPNSDGDDDTAEGEDNIFKGSYLLDTSAWTWKEGPQAQPGGSGSTQHRLEDCGPKRCGHTATLNSETGEVLVFGGRIPGEILAGDIQRLPTP